MAEPPPKGRTLFLRADRSLRILVRQLIRGGHAAAQPTGNPAEDADSRGTASLLAGDPARRLQAVRLMLREPGPMAEEAALDLLLAADLEIMAAPPTPVVPGREQDAPVTAIAAPPAPDVAPSPVEKPETAFLRATRQRRHEVAITLLAKAADVPTGTVRAAVELRDATALVALAWRASFSFRSSELLQREIAGLLRHQILSRHPDGGIPVGRATMMWHLALVGTDAGSEDAEHEEGGQDPE
ncbi:hypothetical protein [Rhizosaccharibacter radicis]|uniref:DUF2336 domain-containing protein n=1 Tax=Rhizosaccharibacter radicis TaxID=2782605 RepID=A0ABT1VVD0_9PROT|nr:hypothetical protein [Acetobacteraceae bacterium KSS12]